VTDVLTPLDYWLADQGRLTAVDRFARWHEIAEPIAPRYREMIPMASPRPGEQYAFEVDLDACTGCKACVAACHSLNGLDETESWRSVGLLYTVEAGEALQQSVTTACHHCVDPACMNGCPVDAYEKDPVTGIVAHLDDQCIGCRYCVLTCPYEVPRFNERLGIVRKCDLCADRLAEGEAPACVQSCPNEAIRVTVVAREEVVARAGRGEFLAGTPDPALTAPATRYLTARPALASAVAADAGSPRPAEGHPPLAVMLVLTQLAVGASVADTVLRLFGAPAGLGAEGPLVALGAGLLALGASVLHLGRPLLAWRAIIGLRHSWLSREIVAFGLFAGVATLSAAASWWPHAFGPRWAATALRLATGAAGLAGLGCSMMIYIVTGRAWWRARHTVVKFTLTAAACGSAAVAVATLVAMLGADAAARTELAPLVRSLVAATMLAATLKLAIEASLLPRARRGATDELGRSALLLLGPLRAQTARRFACGIAGGVVLPPLVALLADARAPIGFALAAALPMLALLVAGELWERDQYFRAAAPPRMPGTPA